MLTKYQVYSQQKETNRHPDCSNHPLRLPWPRWPQVVPAPSTQAEERAAAGAPAAGRTRRAAAMVTREKQSASELARGRRGAAVPGHA
jgi:hypothetical protein